MTETSTEPNPWVESVRKVVGDRAYSMVYDIGFQSRVLPMRSENGAHTMEIHVEMTHAGFPFDLDWRVSFTDRPADGIVNEVIAPADAGGRIAEEVYTSAEQLRAELVGLPYFIRGYFAGRASAAAPPPSQDSAEDVAGPS